MIEISGQEKKIEAFIEQVRPYGIQELARTGRIALVRGDRPLEGESRRRAGDCGSVRGSRAARCKVIPSFSYDETISVRLADLDVARTRPTRLERERRCPPRCTTTRMPTSRCSRARRSR